MKTDHRGKFTISTDKAHLDIDMIQNYLSAISYWAQGRPRDVTEQSIKNSLCFGVYAGNQQVGFARVVTDYATFGWLCDVFILERYQGQNLGKWLIETVVAHPELHAVKRLMLATKDAHELYRKYGGFEPLQIPEKWMTRVLVE